MRKLIAMLALAGAASLVMAQPLTKDERERATSELQTTRKLFLDSVAGLSDAQWNFKPSAEVWSVA